LLGQHVAERLHVLALAAPIALAARQAEAALRRVAGRVFGRCLLGRIETLHVLAQLVELGIHLVDLLGHRDGALHVGAQHGHLVEVVLLAAIAAGHQGLLENLAQLVLLGRHLLARLLQIQFLYRHADLHCTAVHKDRAIWRHSNRPSAPDSRPGPVQFVDAGDGAKAMRA
jgi:hypothetical protein